MSLNIMAAFLHITIRVVNRIKFNEEAKLLINKIDNCGMNDDWEDLTSDNENYILLILVTIMEKKIYPY